MYEDGSARFQYNVINRFFPVIMQYQFDIVSFQTYVCIAIRRLILLLDTFGSVKMLQYYLDSF